jgi:hypothetical protein
LVFEVPAESGQDRSFLDFGQYGGQCYRAVRTDGVCGFVGFQYGHDDGFFVCLGGYLWCSEFVKDH